MIERHVEDLKPDGAQRRFVIRHNFGTSRVHVELIDPQSLASYFPGPGFTKYSDRVELVYPEAPPPESRIRAVLTRG